MLVFNPRFGAKTTALGRTGVGSRARGQAVCQEPSLHVPRPPQGTPCPPSCKRGDFLGRPVTRPVTQVEGSS